VTPSLCSPSNNFTFERSRHQPPTDTVAIRNDAFSLMPIASGDLRRLVLAAAPIVVATWSFGVGIGGFRAHTLLGFGLPEAANPTAAPSRYLDSRFIEYDVAIVSPCRGAARPDAGDGVYRGRGADIIDRFKKSIKVTPEAMDGYYVTGEADFMLVITTKDAP
jgi:hypothetical protein